MKKPKVFINFFYLIILKPIMIISLAVHSMIYTNVVFM